MIFDYTFITLFGYTVYEPMVIVTNLIFFIFALIYFNRLKTFKNKYAKQMGWFALTLGFSMVIGSIGHAVHLQAGELFFKWILFLMNLFSLLSVYFCFRAAHTLSLCGHLYSRKWIYLAIAWLLLVLVFSVMRADFLPIKIHAGIVLIYSLIIHIRAYKLNWGSGNKLVIAGIAISFLSIISHSLHISIDEWFNHKDIAHVIMIISLIIICKGAIRNSSDLEKTNLN